MNKSEFITSLNDLLFPISNNERKKFIAYYEEMIEDYKENGLTEEESIAKIGSPEAIADNILGEQDTVSIKLPLRNKMLIIALLILGFPLWGSILLSVVLFILSLYIVIWCVPFTTGVSCISFFAVGLVSIVGSPFVMSSVLAIGILQLGLGITSIGIAILSGLATVFLFKKFILITKKITFTVINIFNKKVVRI